MPLPASAGAWRAVAWFLKKSGELIPPAVLYLLEQFDDEAELAELAWLRVNLRYARNTPAGTSEDYAQFKLDLVNITGGSVDTSWTAGDFSSVASCLDPFTSSVAALQCSHHTLKEYRGYLMRFNSDDPGPSSDPNNPQDPFADSGPPVWVQAKNVMGGSSSSYPYQLAASVTFRTPWPRHWGRIYLPGMDLGLDSYGRWGTTPRQTIANAVFDLQDTLASAGFLLTVPVSQVNKQRYHALLGVSQVVVDDIPDVVRRRRPRKAAGYAIGVE